MRYGTIALYLPLLCVCVFACVFVHVLLPPSPVYVCVCVCMALYAALFDSLMSLHSLPLRSVDARERE